MALRVEQLSLGPMGTNCYVVRASVDAPEAVVVDPSGDATDLRLRLAQLGARCGAILVTHGHWDHLLGVADLAEGAGAPVYMAEGERELLENPSRSRPRRSRCVPYSPDVLLSGGEIDRGCGDRIRRPVGPRALACAPRVSADDCLFSGDVLFAGSVGRTDLPGSDWDTLLASIRSLVEALPPETVVYPGHGPATTLGEELARNPFLAELRAERAG